ncbi:dTDP-4-dehydrorhamnose reductase [Thiothrix lacustris]|uniref:dTDP-4-dehydrorhamnose reductase n=1 Tax=Thiothrix lacustris TaxID=525917 RepID=A0ABY9MQA4_9GAMM|nr:dTDP-4-dehydrorhamnose reductase [Thiothrix lacustris]WML90411.1 dTDP-4-dehydrorhamnose reductase [Thiothrix lacustris]
MKVLVTGANGQLGFELQATCPAHVQLIATDAHTLDITQTSQIEAAIESHRPDVIINAAAYTAVDKAETDRENAWRINATAPGLLAGVVASYCNAGQAIRLVQVSTDFVFEGQQAIPYLPDDPAKPLSVYGASKLAGEQAVQQHLPDALIVRTSWLYSSHGHNFVKTMLRLMQEKPQLGVVSDQFGTPTWARTLATTLWGCIDQQAQGIFHCSDQGAASWYDFAVAIQEEALALGMLDRTIPIKPIRTNEYPLPAQRPAFSVLDKRSTENLLDIALPHWRVSLRQMFLQLKQATANT